MSVFATLLCSRFGNVRTFLRVLGVLNGSIQIKSARKNWPLLEVLAKITRVLACSSGSQNFCKCLHARSISPSVFSSVLIARKKNLTTARARKSKHTAGMLANSFVGFSCAKDYG